MESTAQRVLIVDDDTMVADTLGLIFKQRRYDVQVCYGAEDGLVCARDFRPHLLLCDLVMPGRNGLTLVKDVTRELPDCRILVLTGIYSDLNAVEKHAREMSRPLSILNKPCQPSDLLREANSMLATA
jgi:ActR/RegA family two-component response regulator